VEVWQTSYLRRLRLGEEKKKNKKIEETTGQNIMSASTTQGGHRIYLVSSVDESLFEPVGEVIS